jgi:hypothetical protein
VDLRQDTVGDPITVRGTGDRLIQGNGWTPWDLSWKDFVKSSALPVPADLGYHHARSMGTPPGPAA